MFADLINNHETPIYCPDCNHSIDQHDDGECPPMHICLNCKMETMNERPCWHCGHDEQDDDLITEAAPTRYQVVMYYDTGINDYTEHFGLSYDDAHDLLAAYGFTYSTTHGNERAYYDNDGLMGSMIPED